MKISVVMSVYGESNYLRESIESILNQTFTDFEFIIVVEYPPKDILDIVNSYTDQRILVVVNNEHLGFARSLNEGIKLAKGEYIARQDADDISCPNRLAQQYIFLEQHPDIVMVGTSIYTIDSAGIIQETRRMNSNPNNELLKRNCVTHGSIMIRRSVLDDVGYYNPTFKYAEDYDLWLRISKKYQIRNLPDYLYKLRMHDTSILSQKLREQVMESIVVRDTALREPTISDNIIASVLRSDVTPFYKNLKKKEKILYHKALAYSYVQNADLDAVKRETREVFRLDPFDVENDITLVASIFGIKGIKGIHQLYRRLRG